MRVAGKSLKISDPVIRTKRRLSISLITGLREVQRLDGGEPRGVTVAALVRLITAELDSVALLGCDRGTVHNVLRPFGRRLNPFDELARVLAPLRIFFRMKQNVAGTLQRDDLVHVAHARSNILEIPDPDVIGQRIFLEPVPGRRPYSRVICNVSLLQADE